MLTGLGCESRRQVSTPEMDSHFENIRFVGYGFKIGHGFWGDWACKFATDFYITFISKTSDIASVCGVHNLIIDEYS